MVKPIIPMMEYYANYDYIATVLCENRDRPYLECNGKCYLQKQIKENNTSNHDHNSPIPAIDLKDYPVSPLEFYTYNFNDEEPNFTMVNSSVKIYQDEYLSTFLQPPQA